MNQFQKELLLVGLIVLASVLPYMHLFSSEFHKTISIFGFEYTHRFPSNQNFTFGVLTRIQMIAFALIFFKVSNRRFRYAVFFLLYWNIYRMLGIFMSLDLMASNTFLFQCIAMVSVLFLVVRVSLIERRVVLTFKLGSTDSKVKLSDFLIAFLILATTINQRVVYDLVPNNGKLSILGFEISNHGFDHASMFLWSMSYKVSTLVLVTICYFTQRKWWRFALLLPILLFIYEIRSLLNPDRDFMVEHEIIEALPLLLVLLLTLVGLSRSAYVQFKLSEIYKKTYRRIDNAIRTKSSVVGSEFIAANERKFEVIKDSSTKGLEELEQLKNTLSQALNKSLDSE